ncbi:MAG: selenium-dependent molybdenum cofactor biosynthesis protein YqeB [Bacillota bacterium]|nr:selenium-dependent molybdenum cofactor biosynthesis protein YqeB [Bacillota bacterium]
MLVLIKGAGDLASGVAVRLHRAGYDIVMTDLPRPTAIRRSVAFCEAIIDGSAELEGIRAVLAADSGEARAIVARGEIAVLADAEALCVDGLAPQVVVDAILAKHNLGTSIKDAPLVIGLGPGFYAGRDCHAVIETMRGHDLGRVIWDGAAAANTGVPGEIAGYAAERLLRTPQSGVFRELARIGDIVEAGAVVAEVDGQPVRANIGGVLRGLLRSGVSVTANMKCGDVDPRGRVEYCRSVSDKARAIGGGVLEAILYFQRSGKNEG